MVKIRVFMELHDAEHCHGCALLRVPNNPDMELRTGGMSHCLKGYHSWSEAVDREASEEAGRLIIVRPESCRKENEVL